MSDDKKIKITCKGSKKIPIESLEFFQGNLKSIEQKDIQKIKDSILKYGFSFPVFVWSGNNKIIDGHQRIKAVIELIDEGYEINHIPVAEIEAASEQEAAEKLLIENSRYAKITDDGLQEFILNFKIDVSMLQEIQLSDIDIGSFLNDVDIEVIESSGGLAGQNYGDVSSSAIPINILGIGGMIERALLKKVYDKLIKLGADEKKDNRQILSNMFEGFIK